MDELRKTLENVPSLYPLPAPLIVQWYTHVYVRENMLPTRAINTRSS